MDFRHTNISANRRFTSYTKVQKSISYIIRNKRIFFSFKEPGVYLNVGCGPNVDENFCNIDYDWWPGVDACLDVTAGIPLQDEYAGGIFSEHMLEHVAFDAALAILEEFRRVLRKGGVLRIVMPDGELYLDEYQKGSNAKIPYVDEDANRYPFLTRMISINRIFRGSGHLFIWDFETLREALLRSGFEVVEKCSFRKGRDNKLLLDSDVRAVESLYAEAY